MPSPGDLSDSRNESPALAGLYHCHQGSPVTPCHPPISPGGFFQGLQLSCPTLSTLHYFLVSLHQGPFQLFWEGMLEFIFLITGNILLYPTYALSTIQILTFKSQFYYKELAFRIPP